MTGIRIDDLPVAENLTPEQEALIIGAGLRSFRPMLEELERREVPAALAPGIDLTDSVLTIKGFDIPRSASNHVSSVSINEAGQLAVVRGFNSRAEVNPADVMKIVYLGGSAPETFTNNTNIQSQFSDMGGGDKHNTPNESQFKMTGPYKLPESSASGQTKVNDVRVGDNTPPPITWTGVPPNTSSFSLTMKDIDAVDNPGGQYTHMVLTDIPVWVRSVQDAVSSGRPGANGSGQSVRYYGPNPPEMPEGKVHRYVWTLTALDANGNVLGQTQYHSTFAYAQGAQTDSGWVGPNR
jgi:phosphatidylethanolamine-binding protein (PEBP) family uncharacterized protein